MEATLITIFATGLVGIVTYYVQQRGKLKTEQYEKKGQLYEEIIDKLFGLFIAINPKERSQQLRAMEKSWLYASDEVLKACYNFLETYDTIFDESGDVVVALKTNSQNRQKMEHAIAHLLKTMRRDLKGTKGDKILESWAREKYEFYEWGAIWQEEPSQLEKKLSHLSTKSDHWVNNFMKIIKEKSSQGMNKIKGVTKKK